MSNTRDPEDDQKLPQDDQATDPAETNSEAADAESEPAEKKELAQETETKPDADGETEAVDSSETAGLDDPVAEKKPGRALTWIALLLGVLGLGAAGYLYWELVYKNPFQTVQDAAANQQTQMTAEVSRLQEALSSTEQQMTATTEAFQKESFAKLEETEEQVLKSLQEALLAAPPSQREWKLAEAEYLLRIANHRVLMERDSRGALILLQAADQIIAELDDFSLHTVRARLADEIVALRQVPQDDLQGVYLRLEALKGQLDGLYFSRPELPEAEVESEEVTVWQEIMAATQAMVRYRELGGEETVKPLLAPQEEQYLELNLRLKFEQAQLAALKRQQDVYEQALTSIREWLGRYTAQEQSVLTSEIDDMLTIQLAHPLPDISGSLNELKSARQGGE